MKGRCLMLHPPHIPKCCQQPRSRRAHHPPFKGSFPPFSVCKDCSSSTTTTSTDQGNYEPFLEDGEDMSALPLFKSNLSWNEDGKRIFSNAGEVPALEVETVTKISSTDSCKNGTSYATWDGGSYLNDRISTHLSAGPSPITADKSLFPVAGNMESWLAPGNVVWAKTPSHEWWPAEVMDVRDILDCTSNHHTGHVLVQLYGNHEPAWLDPVKDLSQFNYCFEERSKNPLEAFQDALKQALLNHVHTSSSALSRRRSDVVKSSGQNGACGVELPGETTKKSAPSKDNAIPWAHRACWISLFSLTCENFFISCASFIFAGVIFFIGSDYVINCARGFINVCPWSVEQLTSDRLVLGVIAIHLS